MNILCVDCFTYFDDARRLSYCPHEPLASDEILDRKDAAARLLMANTVRFNHEADTGPDRKIQSVSWDGMVTLGDLAGEFAPHLFVAVR